MCCLDTTTVCGVGGFDSHVAVQGPLPHLRPALGQTLLVSSPWHNILHNPNRFLPMGVRVVLTTPNTVENVWITRKVKA